MCYLRKTRTADISIIGNVISAKENSKEALKRHLFFYECPSALEEKMDMTGCRKPMLRIAAYHGLKARCIAVLLHTRMSHAGFEPALGD